MGPSLADPGYSIIFDSAAEMAAKSRKPTAGNGRELCRKNSKISGGFRDDRETLANGPESGRFWPIIFDSAAERLRAQLWLFFRKSLSAGLD